MKTQAQKDFKRPQNFNYSQHGLLWIVYEVVDTGLAFVNHEESRWEDEAKAKEHCRLLNKKYPVEYDYPSPPPIDVID